MGGTPETREAETAAFSTLGSSPTPGRSHRPRTDREEGATQHTQEMHPNRTGSCPPRRVLRCINQKKKTLTLPKTHECHAGRLPFALVTVLSFSRHSSPLHPAFRAAGRLTGTSRHQRASGLRVGSSQWEPRQEGGGGRETGSVPASLRSPGDSGSGGDRRSGRPGHTIPSLGSRHHASLHCRRPLHTPSTSSDGLHRQLCRPCLLLPMKLSSNTCHPFLSAVECLTPP